MHPFGTASETEDLPLDLDDLEQHGVSAFLRSQTPPRHRRPRTPHTRQRVPPPSTRPTAQLLRASLTPLHASCEPTALFDGAHHDRRGD